MENFDFGGWATKNGIRCSDGRTIKQDAFIGNDGCTVPLVWNHSHNDPDNVLGHALLVNKEEGVYAYGVFNDTPNGKKAKEFVKHGDIVALSIWANQLKQVGGDVVHGDIKEVSLVLAGANPGAYIDYIVSHGEESDEEAIIFSGESIDIPEENLAHAEESEQEKKDEENKSIKEIYDELTEKQKNVVNYLIAEAVKASAKEDEEDMKHNVFENDSNNNTAVSKDAMAVIFADAKKYGSLKDSYLAHAEDIGDEPVADRYGIDNIDYLFPEAKLAENKPEFISREMTWVDKVMGSVHRTPFARIKSIFANITEDEARAKGYIKGKLKKEEVFSLLKRTTSPTTIYKKQKLDRDDVIDITDFDVVAWIKLEMRMMLNEELARAILLGDGRLASDDDHINTDCIRPVFNDVDLFTVKHKITVPTNATAEDKARAFIDGAIRCRKSYKGSGNPTMYTTEDWVTEMLLLEDGFKHKLYASTAALATALRVKEIVTVEPMEGQKDSNGDDVVGIIVNLSDYRVGADKGGAVSLFDDFDIDYNQQKYLIETRCSGSLVKPYSAVTLSLHVGE